YRLARVARRAGYRSAFPLRRRTTGEPGRLDLVDDDRPARAVVDLLMCARLDHTRDPHRSDLRDPDRAGHAGIPGQPFGPPGLRPSLIPITACWPGCSTPGGTGRWPSPHR